MKKISVYPLIGALLLFIILTFGIFYLLNPIPNSKTVSREDALAIAENLYQGEVLDAAETEQKYKVQLKNSYGIYEIEMDAKDGHVLSVKQLEESKPPDSADQDGKREGQFLSEDDVKTMIQRDYPGAIESIQRSSNEEKAYYNILVKQEDKKISIKLDASTGELLSKKEEIIVQKIKYLTEEEAVAIATQHVKGGVEGIMFRSNGDLHYYLVEIDTDDDDVIVQINSVTGEVLSITNDDDDDDDDDDSD